MTKTRRRNIHGLLHIHTHNGLNTQHCSWVKGGVYACRLQQKFITHLSADIHINVHWLFAYMRCRRTCVNRNGKCLCLPDYSSKSMYIYIYMYISLETILKTKTGIRLYTHIVCTAYRYIYTAEGNRTRVTRCLWSTRARGRETMCSLCVLCLFSTNSLRDVGNDDCSGGGDGKPMTTTESVTTTRVRASRRVFPCWTALVFGCVSRDDVYDPLVGPLHARRSFNHTICVYVLI